MDRSPLYAEIVRSQTDVASYAVKVIDTGSDDLVESTVFFGPNAEGRAKEYAASKYSNYRVVSNPS